MKKELSLIIDIGNSTIVFGLFNGENYVAHVVTGTHKDNEDVRKEKLETFKMWRNVHVWEYTKFF